MYQKEFISEIKQAVPEIELFDLDNHSDPSLFNYAIELIRKSSGCVVIIRAEHDASIGKIALFLEEILKNREKCFLISMGENVFIDRISKQLNNFEKIQNLSESKRLATDYFKDGQ